MSSSRRNRRRILTPAELIGGYPTPEGANGIGCGMGLGLAFGGAVWTPARLLSGHDGAYCEWTNGTAGEVTKNTQPTVPGGGWSGSNWAGSGLGPYTHTTGNTAALAQAGLLIVGNRYETKFTITGRTAGTVTYYAGTTAGTARSTNGTFTEDLTCAGNTSHSFVPSSDFDGVVTVETVENLSITEALSKAATGTLAGLKFVQAAAASMLWWDGGLVGDGVADCVSNNLAASFWPLHHSAGYTIATVFKQTVAVNSVHLMATGESSAFHGIRILANGVAQTLTFTVEAGSAPYVVVHTTAAGTLPLDTYVALTVSFSQTGGLRVLVGGTTETAATAAACSANDAIAPLTLFKRNSGDYMAGIIKSMFVRVGACTDTELAQLHAFNRARFGA